MNTAALFDKLRKSPFPGKLGAKQVAGVEAILAGWAKHVGVGGDPRHLAYILATAYHETGARMQPVREGFAKTDAEARRILAKRSYSKGDPITGHAYYGRGLVQITWKFNYDAMGKRLGIDLVNNPDLALDLGHAVDMLILGSVEGLYTGKKLARYFNNIDNDPKQARRVINGLDRAADVASYYYSFIDAVRAAGP